VLVANVDHVSSLCEIQEEPMVLTREVDMSALSGKEEPPCKDRIENVRRNCAGKQRTSETLKGSSN
jgi:hypothetical protein